MLLKNLIMIVFTIGFVTPAFASMDLDQLSYHAANEAGKTANVRLDAFSILERGYSLAVDAPVGHGWTFGLSFFHYPQSYGLFNFTVNAIGINTMKFFNGKPFRSGWYAGPLAYYVQGEKSVEELGTTPVGMELGARGGYQWMWNRFNIQLGAEGLFLRGLGPVSGAIQGDVNLGYVL